MDGVYVDCVTHRLAATALARQAQVASGEDRQGFFVRLNHGTAK